MSNLAELGASLLDCHFRRVEPCHGGSLSEILSATLADGRKVIVKNGSAPKIEAAMLAAMAAAGAPAPKVLAASDQALVIEWLKNDGALSGAWGSLGQVLARLHAAAGTRYGWPADYAFGSLQIANGWTETWPEFWAERRLQAHIPHLPAALARRVEALCASLSNRPPDRPAPAFLHGDLWGGNILAAGQQITGLVDPACYFGHAEVDPAMLTLFDQPNASFYDAYGGQETGHKERLPVYRLWPILVHVRLFGGSYRTMAERCLDSAGC